MQLQRALLAAFGIFLFQSIHAQTIPLDTAVHTGVLPNGFTYYIRHNSEPKNRVQLYLVNKVGSVLEDDDQQGLAHFMEHMNFNGTIHFPKNELVDYLQKSGIRFGADLNAYTSFDETVYQLPLPTDDASILKNGFQIMRDWAQDATLDSVEISKERGVVLEEERLGRGASERMQRQTFPMMLNYSRYAVRLPIGKVNILDSFPPSAIRRFHTEWYRPDLQALVVVGDINVAETEKLIRILFADLKTPPNEKTRIKYKVELTGKNQFLIVTDREMPETDIQILIKHQAEKLITEDNFRHMLTRLLFNQMIAERFATLSETPNLPFIEAGSDISGIVANLDAFTLSVRLKPGKYKEGFMAPWELVEKVKRFGFTQTELDRAKQSFMSGEEQELKEKDKTNSTSYVGEYQRLFLNQEASAGIDWEYGFIKQNLPLVTLDQINALVKEYIVDSNRDIMVMGPDKDRSLLPDSLTVAGWITTVSNENLTAFADEADLQPLMTAKLSGSNITSVKKIEKMGVTELKLSNGVKVILKSTIFKNDEIRFEAFSAGGTSVYTDAQFQNASNADMIPGFGLAQFGPAQLNKILSGKIVEAEPYIAERSEGIEGGSSIKDLETALQLIYLRFTAPRKDTVLFNNLINNSREMLATRYSDPKKVFGDTVNYVLGNYNIRRSPPTIDNLMQIDLDKTYNIYKQRFADASGFTFVFVGSFNIDSITPLLVKYLGSLPSTGKNEKARDLGIHIPSGLITKKVFKGSENKATVRMVFSGDYTFSPENNMALNAIKEVLSIKITQHLREDESEVYSPSVQVSFGKYPTSRFAFNVSFGCSPANADHLMAGVEKEIAALRDNGPTLEDVNKFKAEYKRVYELQLTQNDFWISYLTNQYQNDESPDQILSYNERLEKLTPELLKQATRKWLDGKNEIRFELLPQSN